MIVWKAPSRAYGVIVGYDVMFLNSGNGEDGTVITKDRDELFHRVEQRNLPNEGGSVLVQVHPFINSIEVKVLSIYNYNYNYSNLKSVWSMQQCLYSFHVSHEVI